MTPITPGGNAPCNPQQARWKCYLAAVLLVAAAALVRVVLLPSLGTRAPFLTLYPAVVLAALYGGLLPGLLAVALSGLTAALWMEPMGSPSIYNAADGLTMGVFLFNCVLIAGIIEALRRAQVRALEAEFQKQQFAERKQAEDSIRKQADEALREGEERLRRAQEIAHLGSWELDLRQDRLIWSDEVYRIFGLAPQEFGATYEAFLERIHPDDRAKVDAAYSDSLREGRDSYEIEHRIVRKSTGEIRFVHEKCEHFRDVDGRIIRSMGMVHDITERKQVEAALHAANERLAEADRLKDEFLAMLAHELRNPLAPIRNAVHILRMVGALEPAAQRQKDVIDRQVTHMARLLDDLLDISRVTRGIIQIRKSPLHLADVLAHAVETVTPLIQSHHHRLHFPPTPDDILVEGDIDRLAQIVGNLLTNAAKYTEEGGQIWLDAVRKEDFAVIRVRDSGMGIDQEMLPHIFKLFTQAHRSLDRSQGGLGIGLTMVRRLAELHGGTVEAHSEGLGKGSEFIVRLPALPAFENGSECDETSRDRLQPMAEPSRRVLVVDDMRDTALSLAEVLELRGHEVRVAFDGPSAIETARAFKPEVILLDIGMPGMDGYEVAQRLRAEYGQAVALVALTGYGQDQDREQAEQAGFDDHLVKPVDLKCLFELLARRPAAITT